MNSASYVLVTPVRDEVSTIGTTIEAVGGQTVPPREWIIVSDGSTDGTNDIVSASCRRYPWIRLLSRPQRPHRDFAAVVRNTEAGVDALECHDYRYIGLLDADLDFRPDYFQQLIARFEAQPHLGLAGGVVIDTGTPRSHLPRNCLDVPGAVQFFRRQCFEAIGGLVPIPEGGWDCISCTVARMRGFETRLFTDLVVDHLKPRNISQGRTARRLWQMGARDYALGYDPLFELLKCASRLSDTPFSLASLAPWFGYIAAALRRKQRIVPQEVVAHLRHEQRRRTRAVFRLSPVEGRMP